MFEKLRHLLGQQSGASAVPDEAVSVAQAAAMLLLEVAWADHEIEDSELEGMRRTLKSLYRMEDTAIETLIRRARADHDQSTGLFPFTRTLNDALTPDEKTALLTELWRLTRFGGERHHYEEHAIRRIADLLYLGHEDFIAAKLAARKRP
ncbi:MAG: TerB family tellurite resistance protein [Gammaproteobacteria bacterium]|nr:TerB family tellurite resistance protein [Gammaproteobacteria bacterium]